MPTFGSVKTLDPRDPQDPQPDLPLQTLLKLILWLNMHDTLDADDLLGAGFAWDGSGLDGNVLDASGSVMLRHSYGSAPQVDHDRMGTSFRRASAGAAVSPPRGAFREATRKMMRASALARAPVPYANLDGPHVRNAPPESILAQRLSLSGSALMEKGNVERLLAVPPVRRSAEQLADLVAAHRHLRFFAALEDMQLVGEICRSMGYMSLPPGRMAFDVGTEADAFFIIRSGRVRISTATTTGADAKTLAVLCPGDSFGELGLIHKAPRAARATAVGAVELLVLGERDYLRTLYEKQKKQVASCVEVIRSHHVLRGLSERDLVRVAAGAARLSLGRGDSIYREGQRATGLYLVGSGEVLCTVRAKGGVSLAAGGVLGLLKVGPGSLLGRAGSDQLSHDPPILSHSAAAITPLELVHLPLKAARRSLPSRTLQLLSLEAEAREAFLTERIASCGIASFGIASCGIASFGAERRLATERDGQPQRAHQRLPDPTVSGDPSQKPSMNITSPPPRNPQPRGSLSHREIPLPLQIRRSDDPILASQIPHASDDDTHATPPPPLAHIIVTKSGSSDHTPPHTTSLRRSATVTATEPDGIPATDAASSLAAATVAADPSLLSSRSAAELSGRWLGVGGADRVGGGVGGGVGSGAAAGWAHFILLIEMQQIAISRALADQLKLHRLSGRNGRPRAL